MLPRRPLPVGYRSEGYFFTDYPLHHRAIRKNSGTPTSYSLSIPLFFFEGTRDPFCDLKILEDVLKKVTAPWGWEIIEGGDHSFEVPTSRGMDLQTVYQNILDQTVKMIKSGFLNQGVKTEFLSRNEP